MLKYSKFIIRCSKSITSVFDIQQGHTGIGEIFLIKDYTSFKYRYLSLTNYQYKTPSIETKFLFP